MHKHTVGTNDVGMPSVPLAILSTQTMVIITITTTLAPRAGAMVGAMTRVKGRGSKKGNGRGQGRV